MKKRLMNNLGLKLLSVICAFFLWLIVLNINDPVDYQQFTGVQVEMINADAITGEGKVYEILDNSNVITVTVKAKRSILDTLSRENIRAVADLSEVTITNTVSIKLSSNKYNSSIDNAYKQLADSNSLLNTYKTLLVLRNNNIALKYSNNLVKHEGSTSQLLAYTRTATYNNKTQTVLVVHNISKSALNMIDCDGKVLYASNGATSLEQLAQIPGRSTVIIDITGGSN